MKRRSKISQFTHDSSIHLSFLSLDRYVAESSKSLHDQCDRELHTPQRRPSSSLSIIRKQILQLCLYVSRSSSKFTASLQFTCFLDALLQASTLQLSDNATF